jgi:uncharacterized phage protein (TIGR02218 family)
MKTISIDMATHLAQDDTTLVPCCKVTRLDGEVFGFTAHDQDLVINADGLGDVTYYSVDGFSNTALSATEGLNADNIDLQFLFFDDRITEHDILTGKFLRAGVKFFWVNWSDLTMGIIKGLRGYIGPLTLHRDNYVLQCQDLRSLLQQDIGENYSPECRADLGDSRCQVALTPLTWTPGMAVSQLTTYTRGQIVTASANAYPTRQFRCTTTGVTGGSEPAWNPALGATTADGTVVWTTELAYIVDCEVTGVAVAVYGEPITQQFTVSPDLSDFDPVPPGGNIAFPWNTYFAFGTTQWLTGDNAGDIAQIKMFDKSVSTITLFEPPWSPIQVGDTLRLTVGCDKQRDTCIYKFHNIVFFRGEPHLPGLETFLRTPEAP